MRLKSNYAIHCVVICLAILAVYSAPTQSTIDKNTVSLQNNDQTCMWQFGEWSTCQTFCNDAQRSRVQYCVCNSTSGALVAGDSCPGTAAREYAPCQNPNTICPHSVRYWKTHNSAQVASQNIPWPASEETTFNCPDDSDPSTADGRTWLQILQNQRTDLWNKLAQQYIAAKLSELDGAYLPDSVSDSLAEADSILTQCQAIQTADDRQEVQSLITLLQKYTYGKIDPTGAGGLSSDANEFGQLNGGGSDSGAGDEGSAQNIMAFFVAIPTVTVLLISLAVVLTFMAVRRRYNKARSNSDSSDQDSMYELQAQIDKGNQEESGEDVDVDELEDLKL